MSTSDPRLRALFLNENIGGHATMHRHLRGALTEHPEVDARFVDLPRPGLPRKLFAAQIPGLARLDLDFQPLRAQLAQSFVARRLLCQTRTPFDVLHAYTQNSVLLSADMLAAVPSVVSLDITGLHLAFTHSYRSPTRFTPLRVRAGIRFERRVLDAATLVVAHSEWAAQSLREEYHVPGERIRIIPFGITLPSTPTPRVVDAPPQVTFIGTQMDRKGGWRLLRVWRRHLRDRCTLNLITRDPVPEEPGVRVFNDIVADDPRHAALLAETSVLAFPTEIDAFGYAAIEAMAAGVPVVATRLHALPEIVEDGVTGLLVAPDDDELAAALRTLLDDDELRSRMGEAGRAVAYERFDARRTTAALLEVLELARQLHRSRRRAPAAP
jgi:glycosyltransferase involved in cell wall biosynthesis